MPPSGPRTAPENSEAQAITMLIGNPRQSIFDTSPDRLSSIDSPSIVGAFRYLTSRPTNSENGRQMTGNIHGLARTNAFSHRSLFTVEYTRSQARTATAPMTATMTTWTYGWTGCVTVTASSGVPTPVASAGEVVFAAASVMCALPVGCRRGSTRRSAHDATCGTRRRACFPLCVASGAAQSCQSRYG